MIKFFDLKAGIGKFSIPTLYSEPEELIRIMDSYSIEKAIVYHSLSREINPVEGNLILLNKIKGFKNLIPAWGLLPPGSGDIEDFEKYILEGLKNNVRIFIVFPHIYRIPLYEFVKSSTFDILEKIRIPVIIEPDLKIWEVDKGDWFGLRVLCEEHPALPVIFSEFRTRYHIRIVLQFLKEFPNFYYDIGSCWNYKSVEKLVEITGGERLITGTNLPFSHPGQSIGMVLLSDIPEAIKRKIAYENLLKLIEGVKVE